VSATFRPFIKEEREVQYRDQGSVVLTDRERSAARLIVTIDILSVTVEEYRNDRYVPPDGFYGYMTFFRGAAVWRKMSVDFPKQRVWDEINWLLWLYYTARETVTLIMEGFSEIVADIGEGVNNLLEEVERPSVVASAFSWFFRKTGEVWEFFFGEEDESAEESSFYIPLPIPSPHPDIIKFKAASPGQFRIRVEGWHYESALAQSLNPPVDVSDPTEGEDQYSSPAKNSPDDPYSGLPNPSPLDPLADPRDVRGSEDPDEGTSVEFSVVLIANPGGCGQTTYTGRRTWENAAPGPYTARPGESDQAATAICGRQLYRGWLIEASNGTIFGPFDETAGIYDVTSILWSPLNDYTT